MIELIQTATIFLIVIGGYYQRKNFVLMSDRLKQLELEHLEWLKNGKGKRL